jgi:hypothetical protein
MSDQASPGPESPPPTRRFVAQVVGNTTLLTAVLVYMGWAYENALLGYFHLSPFNLNLSIVEYTLHSLDFFNTDVVFAAVALIVVTVVGVRGLRRLTPLIRSGAISRVSPDNLVAAAGLVITVAAAAVAWTGVHNTSFANWFEDKPGLVYLVIALVGVGPLLLTWPTRRNRQGHILYALAIVTAAMCALWAASLYANNLGHEDAEKLAQGLPTHTSVIVYSIQPLDLTGPGVHRNVLQAGDLYHYRYYGLRLLFSQSGTYYLLPVRWSQRRDPTYIINDSNDIRIEPF